MKGIVLTAYGDPATGLEFRELPEPASPGAGQVMVAVDYAPINFSDILVARGLYPLHPELPSVIGNEGAGRVLEVGAGVSNVRVGDRVTLPMGSFTWRERMVVNVDGIVAPPADADPSQLAMLTINPPTAHLLLETYVHLGSDEWIAINAANSAIARWIVGFAKQKGVRTLGLVRRAEAMSAAQEAGCDLVLLDDDDAPTKMTETLAGKRVRLALDAVSGEAAGRLAKLLGPRGTLVSYAAPSFAAIAVSPFDVIFNDLTIRGFSLGNPDFAGQIPGAIMQASKMVAAGEVAIPVAATYRLEEIGAAISHQMRGGKVLLKVSG
ncbi:zinc-dependent alcohol dehydrogenase family protein [Paraburkholderia sp. RL17-347-BIC-D]|uniref:zinc-dependent alcohol dehydrogenase family protein n=1 Tax=Paraburkholderia sp. RL17-347-BIC-D TaxID=3031632 RepID=UPI0038BD4C28